MKDHTIHPETARLPRSAWQAGALFWLAFCLTAAFCVATRIEPWHQSWAGNRGDRRLLATLFGDSRRVFANLFFIKADAYFHSGYYPTIYDNRESFQTPHIGEDSGQMEGRNTGDEENFLGKPRDWVDRFNRNFFPSKHTHLDEGGNDGSNSVDNVREILPWLRLSAELDPNCIETYTVTAYWLRKRMGRISEAEQFIRDGLRANPNHPTLLLELGRLYWENRKEADRARNLFELALKNWQETEGRKPEPDKFLLGQIAGALASLERATGHPAKAIGYFRILETVSPSPEQIRVQITELEQQLTPKP